MSEEVTILAVVPHRGLAFMVCRIDGAPDGTEWVTYSSEGPEYTHLYTTPETAIGSLDFSELPILKKIAVLTDRVEYWSRQSGEEAIGVYRMFLADLEAAQNVYDWAFRSSRSPYNNEKEEW